MKIMRIVFEVASCSWKDDIEHNSIISCKDENDNSNGRHLNDINLEKDDDDDDEDKSPSLFDDREALLLRSMILRKHYGGMSW